MRNGAPGRKRGEPTSRESSAGGVVYRIEDGKALFLLIRDSYGNWGFPKGHLEPGEPADIAALREVKEETGLQSLRLKGSIATIEWVFRFRGSLVHKNCQFFLMESDTADTKPQKSEGITDCRWAGVEEAQTLIAYENARGVLRAAGGMVAASRSEARSR
jgi:8-oxo-dGTP pyrophosphatase MutT (NUDIX family)